MPVIAGSSVFTITTPRRRFVKDQDADVSVERAEDFDSLLLSDGELPDCGVGVYLDAVAIAQFG
jgi:hypothetical protein